MVYNLSLGNETGMLGLIQMVNSELMFGWLGMIFLIGIAFVLFTGLMFKTNDFGKSITATSFICFVLALSLAGLDLVSNLMLFVTLLGTAGGVAWGRIHG